MTTPSYTELIANRSQREREMRAALQVEVEQRIKTALDKEEAAAQRQEYFNSIRYVGQEVIRSNFAGASLQPTSAEPSQPNPQLCILLFHEAEHVDSDEFTALGGGLSIIGGKRGLSFFLAEDGEIYYGYTTPYAPKDLTAWSVHKLWLGAAVATDRLFLILESLIGQIFPGVKDKLTPA